MSGTTIYTKPNCGDCEKTTSMLDNLGVKYEKIDISVDKDALAFLKNNGFRAAPVVFNNGESWAGFNESKIRSIASSNNDSDSDWDF